MSMRRNVADEPCYGDKPPHEKLPNAEQLLVKVMLRDRRAWDRYRGIMHADPNGAKHQTNWRERQRIFNAMDIVGMPFKRKRGRQPKGEALLNEAQVQALVDMGVITNAKDIERVRRHTREGVSKGIASAHAISPDWAKAARNAADKIPDAFIDAVSTGEAT
jgi:hypothetical protein